MSVRSRRVSGELQRAVGEVLARVAGEVCDGLLTVTAVEVSTDLRAATAFVSVLGGGVPGVDVVARLNARAAELRRDLRGRIYLRYLPAVRYELDESGERAARIARLLDDWHAGSPDTGEEH